MDMGIVNAGMVGVYDDLEPVLRERVEDVVLNRRPDAGERLVEIAESAKGAAKDDSARSLAWRTPQDRERAPEPRAGARHHRLHHRRHRRSLAPSWPGRPPAARDRRPADGRHEHRGRPVRPGQDVPAPGGEERARDEAGRGPPAALHRGRKAQLDRRPAATSRPRARSSSPPSRATCTTSARTSSPWCCSATTSRWSTWA
jgi:hypothetical protein